MEQLGERRGRLIHETIELIFLFSKKKFKKSNLHLAGVQKIVT